MSSFNSIFLSLVGGILPALLWLWFWLKEDKLHPEPKSRIVISFMSGMLAVWPAIELEKLFCTHFEPGVCIGGAIPGLLLIILWAATEEILKFVATYLSSFWKNKYNDEPIDAIIYMITAALGFSALENTLFIFKLMGNGDFLQGIMTGNSRFLGATILHVASSAAIGVMMGLSYYKKPQIKKIFLFTGVILSVLLHTIFNLLIIEFKDDLFFVFAGVWILIVFLIALIEKVKVVSS